MCGLYGKYFAEDLTLEVPKLRGMETLQGAPGSGRAITVKEKS